MFFVQSFSFEISTTNRDILRFVVEILRCLWYNLFVYLTKGEVDTMAVSYKKLWHILLDRDLKKKRFGANGWDNRIYSSKTDK